MMCQICFNDYRHLGAHVAQKHKLYAKDYKIKFGLDIGFALIDDDVKDKKRKAYYQNPTPDNLSQGKKFRISKGQILRHYFSKDFLSKISACGKKNRKYTKESACKVASCGIVYYCKGYCVNHYHQYLRRIKRGLRYDNLHPTPPKPS